MAEKVLGLVGVPSCQISILDRLLPISTACWQIRKWNRCILGTSTGRERVSARQRRIVVSHTLSLVRLTKSTKALFRCRSFQCASGHRTTKSSLMS
ncbi:hypothetical protein M758_5G130100 [Ceratodon purpureus]|nr:hypothetical protein M758_5G130100 [Ceratodon purpureus]